MAKRPAARKAASEGMPAIDEAATYRVRIKSVCTVGGARLRPRDRHVLSGRAVKQLGEAVVSAEKV